jgi:DNA invertase Pin-like site-specific DNA recombinase
MKAVAYIRVSTKGQADKDGPERQARAISHYCGVAGLRLTDTFTDEVSGTITDRPALSELIAAKPTIVVIERLDRLARTLTTQEAILDILWHHGIQVHAADPGALVDPDDPDDPMRTALRQIQGVIAQLNRSLALRNMNAGKQAKREAGGYTGGTPAYGYQLHEGSIIPNPTEQRTIARAHELRDMGMSLRSIGAALTSEGYEPRGRRWYPPSVASVLDADPIDQA